jgi:hypothetical protein
MQLGIIVVKYHKKMIRRKYVNELSKDSISAFAKIPVFYFN